MNIKQLEQYRDLQEEVKDLEARLARAQQNATLILTDVVEGSSPYFPYTKHPIAVSGVSPRSTARANRILRLYRTRSEAALQQLEEIQQWIATIKDSKVRRLIELRFVDGKSWRVAARRVFGKPCESTARSRVERFLEKNL